jgi:hypothetical protein
LITTKSTRAIAIAVNSILLALFLLGGIGLMASTTPAAAAAQINQTDGLQMTALAAFDGYFKYGEWLPVFVELENQGADVDGDVRIQVTGSQGTLVFDAPVTLPSGSRKLVTVYVLPNNFSRELDVRFVSKEKALATQKVAVRPQPNISYVIGLVTPERGALALLNGLRFPGAERTKILVDISLDGLPERAEALGSFDLIILNDTDTSKLSPQQSAALASWVQQGGRLVVGGGAGAQQTLAGLPSEMLLLQVKGTSEIDSDSLKTLADFAGSDLSAATGKFVVARSEARPGATGTTQTLVANGDLPLVQEWNWGVGKVNYIALDLSTVPFNGWPGTLSFWQNLIGASGSFPENMPFDVSMRQFRANSLVYPLSNIPSLDLPSVKGLSILLVIYILIIGPVNYLVLRRLRRLHLAWITIPVLTLLFAGGAFGIGYAMRGTDLILNKIALIETRPDGAAAVTSYMGLFSPRMQSYEITIQSDSGESLISPMSGFDSGMQMGPGGVAAGTATGPEMVFIQGQPSRVRGLSVNQWAMQSFVSENTWPNFGTLTGNLRLENEVLVGTVHNASSYTLTDVVVTMQGRFVRLGDLTPGQEKTVNLAFSGLQSDRFGPPLSYRLYQQDFPNGPMPRAIEQKMNIISSVFENGPIAKMLSSAFPVSGNMVNGASTSILIFGWLDQAPPTVEVEHNLLTQKTTALVYSTLDYTFPGNGFISLPPGMVPGSITKMPPNSGNCGGTTSIQMMQGDAEFEFQIPTNLQGFQVNTLKLNVWQDNGNMGSIIPAVSLYNWQNKAWTSIQDPIPGTNVIKNARPYVSDNGAIWVKMSSQSNTNGCIYLDVGLEAEKSTSQGAQP